MPLSRPTNEAGPEPKTMLFALNIQSKETNLLKRRKTVASEERNKFNKDISWLVGIFVLCQMKTINYTSSKFPAVYNFTKAEMCMGRKNKTRTFGNSCVVIKQRMFKRMKKSMENKNRK